MIDAAGSRTGLILGSSSPRRSALLRQVGARFSVRTADTDESLHNATQPEVYVSELSRRKADAVSASITNGDAVWDDFERVIIIGADTVVVGSGGCILGKPKDGADARRMLETLSGKWHEVYTGVALIEKFKAECGAGNARARRGESHFSEPLGCKAYPTLVEYEVTRVRMRVLNDDTIDLYIKTGEPDGKAGAYAIQGAGSLLVDRIEGCYNNVVGLPLRLLGSMLDVMGYNLLKK